MSDIIARLHQEFLAEAAGAPKLFADLARVEQYIAETYTDRSLLELLQNADDALATRFSVVRYGADLAVANDGRAFTPQDVEALCRSGASTKTRGTETIGYRGIGFKSTATLCRSISVVSGQFQFQFDRDQTRRALGAVGQVPLIRVPHPIPSIRIPAVYQNFAREGFTTVFIFHDISEHHLGADFGKFDRSSLLFLRNVEDVQLDLSSVIRRVRVRRQPERQTIAVSEGPITDLWRVLRHRESLSDMIAFRVNDEFDIVPAESGESLIHAFTPTMEPSGARIKINGDYSTDPSRKHIDWDEHSEHSFSKTIELLSEHMRQELETDERCAPGLFAAFVEPCPISKAKRRLYDQLRTRLMSASIRTPDGLRPLVGLALRPDWLNYDDYERLLRHSAYLPKAMALRHPELPQLLSELGLQKLGLDACLRLVSSKSLSPVGLAEIATKAFNQYRFDLTGEKLELLRKAKIFPAGSGTVAADTSPEFERLDPAFVKYVRQGVAEQDLTYVAKKLGFRLRRPAVAELAPPAVSERSVQPQLPTENVDYTTRITKWRSAEKNAAEYVRAMPGVLSVSDVSVANMGYDLEVVLENGTRLFVEVKSVTSFTEAIKITNNEYSSAHNCGSRYVLAIVVNADDFQIRVITDPIGNLTFEKQIERWSWVCDDYAAKLLDPAVMLKGENK